VWKKQWHSSVSLEDLTDEEKENLAMLHNLTLDARSQYEMITDGDYLDEVVTMLQVYMKDNDDDKGKDILKLLTKNAFSSCENRVTEMLQNCLNQVAWNDVSYRPQHTFEEIYLPL
jgi:hypothetical protein